MIKQWTNNHCLNFLLDNTLAISYLLFFLLFPLPFLLNQQLEIIVPFMAAAAATVIILIVFIIVVGVVVSE
jgi:hypothetical protein